MLNHSRKTPFKKFLPQPQLSESFTSEVVVSVTDPLTGVSEERHEFITKVREQSPVDAVRQESADLYSIENLQQAGINPIYAPVGGFVKNGLDAVDTVEATASDIDYLADQKQPSKVEPTPNVEPSNNE